MRMNGKEAMQALLDGKTLEHDNPWYLIKLNDKGNLVGCNCKKGKFRPVPTPISDMDRIYEEYPLTFEQAIKAMVDGKVVANNTNMGLFRFKEGFEYSTFGNCWNSCVMGTPKHEEYKWKVVDKALIE